MQLKDGGLYETKHGKRFRVTDNGDYTFSCRSFGGYWYADGRSVGKVWIDGKERKPNLIREIDESRWVPISACDDAGMGPARYLAFKHRQKLVSRVEAKAIGEAGRIKGLNKSDTAVLDRVGAAVKLPQTDKGKIELKDRWNFDMGFTWVISNDGNHSVLDIETTSGVKATFRL